jgi:hypothetical protein
MSAERMDPMAPLVLAGFEVVSGCAGESLELVLRGNADMRASAALKTYLKEVDAEARRRGVGSVRVNLRELYFFNSSCFQALAGWLASVGARESGDRYKVTFETHPAQLWQKRSLEAIRRIAPDLIVVA